MIVADATERPRLSAMLVRHLRSATAGSVATGLVIQAGLATGGPMVARLLGVQGRGELAALVLWPAVLAQVGAFGLPLALTFSISQAGALPATAGRRLALVGLVQAGLVVALHGAILALWLRDASDDVRAAGMLLLGLGPAFLARDYGLALLQGLRDFRRFNAVRLIGPVFYPLSIAALFVVGERSIALVAAAVVSVQLTMGVAAFTLGLVRLRVAVRGADGDEAFGVREMLRFGARGLFGNASPVDALKVDQLAIALLMAPSALGLYVVGAAFTNAARFVAQGVGLVAYPSVAQQADPVLARKAMWPYVWVAGGLSLAIVLPLEVFAPVLVQLFFGSEFADAALVLRLLMPGVLLLAVRRTLADGLRGCGRPGIGTTAEIVSWACLGVALVGLVPLWGVNGVAVAMTLTQLSGLAALLVTGAVQGAVRMREASAPPRELWAALRVARV